MNSSSLYVDVVVPFPLASAFTYHYDELLSGQIQVGKRIVVPFRNKPIVAIVLKLHGNKPEGYETKAVVSIVDTTPSVSDIQLNFWSWIANYYQCTIGEVMKAAIPASLRLDADARISVDEEVEPQRVEQWDNQTREIYYYALGDRDLKLSKLVKEFGKEEVYQIVSSLMRESVFSCDGSARGVQKRMVKMVRLSSSYRHLKTLEMVLKGLSRAPKQQELMVYMMDECRIDDNWAYGFSTDEIKKRQLYSGVRPLVQKGIIELFEVEERELINAHSTETTLPCLSEVQETAYKEILHNFFEKQVVLLHGVTASGKTEIYIRLIADCLKQNKQVLYLLPEIGLTTQIIRRLKSVFGNRVAIYHSRISDNERLELWEKMHAYDPSNTEGECQVILGARSAIFLPFKRLGLIIVDEEHESSFKQYDPSPRYNARDAAIVLSHIHQCKTLLGSATPSVETYYNAESGKFGLVTLTQRYNDIVPPEIVITDISEAKRTKSMQGAFTPVLVEEIKQSLENKKQVILFQNRRGYGLFVQCNSCGWTPKCLHCDVSLTYHKADNSLVCHYCGYKMYFPKACPTCHGKEIKDIGHGTEKIEAEIKELFPEAKLLRMDLDTTRKKNAFDHIIGSFERHEADILIGTQMVTKGLDFSNVAVVGIINADAILKFPDFRAYERSFQLMLQVSGRAGRLHGGGKVVIQTSDPTNPLFNDVIKGDYPSLYRSQIKDREMFHYPPFYRMVSIMVKHKYQNIVDTFANQLAYVLRQQFGDRVLGPEYPLLSRVQNSYQKQIILKYERDYSISAAKKLIEKIISHVLSHSSNKNVSIIIDVDPL
ncbi:primosomal protein N' [Halosquirtibacter xylanolyticus]|uniref:replication restart helicase PriA n=1 Tax=Halosquirtibacter xylanolyticus TaxID=3374599 RepID=UPI0037482D59|nr:primosomal protein N' [Prolixibacteraceae bacterium]